MWRGSSLELLPLLHSPSVPRGPLDVTIELGLDGTPLVQYSKKKKKNSRRKLSHTLVQYTLYTDRSARHGPSAQKRAPGVWLWRGAEA